MEREQLKCYAILKANQIKVEELPEEIQEKIEILNKVIDSADDIDENDEREWRDWSLKVDARDDSVVSDLEGYIAKRKEEKAKEQMQNNQDKPEEMKKMSFGGRMILEEKPKWMFW